MAPLRFKAVCRAFGLHPQSIYSLEARGTLPELPHTSPGFVRELARWYQSAHGTIPAAAESLMGRLGEHTGGRGNETP